MIKIVSDGVDVLTGIRIVIKNSDLLDISKLILFLQRSEIVSTEKQFIQNEN